jgi:hypothetical protein
LAVSLSDLWIMKQAAQPENCNWILWITNSPSNAETVVVKPEKLFRQLPIYPF